MERAHEWKDEYYGTRCVKCEAFHADGNAPWDDDEYDDEVGDDEEEFPFDCGCSMAGSEECDFECPNRDEMIAQLNRKAKK